MKLHPTALPPDLSSVTTTAVDALPPDGVVGLLLPVALFVDEAGCCFFFDTVTFDGTTNIPCPALHLKYASSPKVPSVCCLLSAGCKFEGRRIKRMQGKGVHRVH